MEEHRDIMDIIEEIADKDKRYKAEAYLFLMRGLDWTVSKLKNPRHVSGGELAKGMRLYAINQFGPMARSVLENWGISSTEDFGNIVFNLVEEKLLSKTQEDSIEDFKDVYDFKEAFNRAVRYKID